MAQDHLPVTDEEPVPERDHLGAPRPHAQHPRALRLTGAAHRSVEGVRDRAPGARDLGQQVVGIGVPEQGGHGVVVLTQEAVATPTGHDVDGVPHVEEQPGGRVEVTAGPLDEPRLRERGQDGKVSQPAAGLLEVGLEGLGEVAVAGVPGGEGLEQLREPAPGARAPVVADGRASRRHQVTVPRDRRQVEQAHRRGQVGLRHAPALGDGPDAVVQADAGVPDGVPDPVGHPGHRVVPEGPPIVEQDEVDVAERAGLGAPDTAHRRQRDPAGPQALGGLGPDARQPRGGVRRQGRPPPRTRTRLDETPQVRHGQPPALLVHSHCPLLPG